MERRSAGVDDLVIFRVDSDLAVVHRAVVVVAHELPGLALVVGAPDAAAFRIGRLWGALPSRAPLRLRLAASLTGCRLLAGSARLSALPRERFFSASSPY